MKSQHLQIARTLGETQMQLSFDAATSSDPTFGARAYAFIVSYVREHGEASGEQITDAAIAAGIRPKDQRAFGAVYAKAIRNQAIRIVGTCQRKKGHGTAGGRLYSAAGVDA